VREAALLAEKIQAQRQLGGKRRVEAEVDPRDTLGEQRAVITTLMAPTTSSLPYIYLRDIHDKKIGADSNKPFIFHNQDAFKRELGFLIDRGYIENVNLDLFTDNQDILTILKVTETGELLINLRETGTPLPELQSILAKLVPLAIGEFPYRYLKDIRYKRIKGNDQEFIFQSQSAFKRELGFLVDGGYIQNLNLDLFADGENILNKLTITDAGKLLVELRENGVADRLGGLNVGVGASPPMHLAWIYAESDNDLANIIKLLVLSVGEFPYTYLSDIRNKKLGRDQNKEFLFQDHSAFKRELGFLIDSGYIKNIDLGSFANGQNILDKITITEAGALLIITREALIPAP
jgi:hypothetical protein